MPLHQRHLSYEPLEPREMLSATPTPLPSSLDSVSQALLGASTRQWTATELQTIIGAALKDPAFVELGSLTADMDAAKVHLQSDSDQDAYLTQDIGTISTDLAAQQALLQPHLNAVTSLTQSISDLQKQSDALKSQINATGITYAARLKEQKAIPSQLAPLPAEIASYQAQIADDVIQLANYSAMIPAQQQQVAAALAAQQALGQKVNANQRDKNLRKQYDAQVQYTCDLQKQASDTGDRVRFYQAEIQTLQQLLATDQANLSQLQARQAALPGEIKSLLDQYNAAQATLTDDLNAIPVKQAALDAEQQTVASLQPRVTQDSTALQADQTVLTTLRAHVFAEQQSFADMQSVVTDMVTNLLLHPELLSAPDMVQSLNLAKGTKDATGALNVNLPMLGGTASFQSWQGTSSNAAQVSSADITALTRALQARGVSDTSSAHGWLQSTGALTAVDLKSANRCVRDVAMRVVSDHTTNTVTALAYRGEKLIASQVVGADGKVQLHSDEGITSVLLQQTDKASTLFVADVNVDAWKDEAQPAAAALTPATNHTVAEQSAPLWESGKAYNYLDVMKQWHVSTFSAGDPKIVYGTRTFSSAFDNRTEAYSRHDILSSTGVQLAQVSYVNESGVHLLPQEYWMQVSSNSIITFPGSPKHLVYGVIGNGSFDVAENNIATETLSEAMPVKGVSMQSSTLQIRGVGPKEGWGDVPPTLSTRSFTPVGGSSVNVLFEVRNAGTGSGTIRVRVHSGSTGTVSDAFIKEFTEQVGGLSRQTLSANAPIVHEGDFVTLEIINSDGTSSVQTQKMHLTIEQGSSSLSGSVTHAAQVLQQKIVDAVFNDDQLLAYRSDLTGTTGSASGSASARLAADMVAAAYARMANPTAATPASVPVVVTDEMKGKVVAVLASAGLSTDNVNNALDGLMTKAPDTYNDMLQWYNASGFTAVGTRADTAMGKIFLGLVQKLLPHADRLTGTATTGIGITNDPHFDDFDKAAKAIESITGISALKILHTVDLRLTFATRANAQAAITSALQKLFTDEQYGDIFQAGPLAHPDGEVRGVHVDKSVSTGVSYTDTDDHVRVRFDFADPTLQYDHGNVYLIDAMGNVIGGTNAALISGDFRNTLFVDIPLDRIRSLFPNGVFHGQVRVKIGLWAPGNTTTQGMQGQVFSETMDLNLRGNLVFDPVTVLGEATWKALTPAQQAAVKSELDFGRVDSEKSRAVLQWLVTNFLSSSSTEAHKMTYDALADQWKGVAYTQQGSDDQSGECKYWLQMQVVEPSIGIYLPPNSKEESPYNWQITSNDIQTITIVTNGKLSSSIQDNALGIQAGDFIQMSKSEIGDSQHTLLIGKIETDGIWVFDSNALSEKLTPSYRKMLWNQLDSYNQFSVYRLNA